MVVFLQQDKSLWLTLMCTPQDIEPKDAIEQIPTHGERLLCEPVKFYFYKD